MTGIYRWMAAAFKLGCVVVGVGICGSVACHTIVGQIDARRAKAAETVNAPDILIDHNILLEYPDPLHVKLPDGRLFRLAHLLAPPPDTPEYAAALNEVKYPLAFGGNRLRGLRIVGTNNEGETLVELWGFHTALGGNSNRSWSEQREARIPRWNSLTWQLVSTGLFQVDPQSTDPELRRWQDVARSERKGLWANPDFVLAAQESSGESIR